MEKKISRSNKSEALPEDMQREILVRLPFKSLVKFNCVSKKWASISLEKQFNDLYLPRSMTRPRMLFMFNRDTDLLIHSVYQEEEPFLSSRQQQMRISFEISNYDASQSIRGLICLHFGTKVVLCNPSMNKFQTLPEIQAPRKGVIKTFFGYDEATKVFKVLCVKTLVYEIPSEEANKHLVFTVGSDKESWRPIRCKHDHFPSTNGLCKGGVMYYGAMSNKKPSLMSFNVSSEEFSVIDLPEVVEVEPLKAYGAPTLVNYNGEIALVNHYHNIVERRVRNGISDYGRETAL